MPVEVRKLVIKTTVVEDNQSSSSATASSGQDAESIIKECVNKILELLKEKNER